MGLQQACYSHYLLSYSKSCTLIKHKSVYQSYLSIYVHQLALRVRSFPTLVVSLMCYK